jgi:hypothetical protein
VFDKSGEGFGAVCMEYMTENLRKKWFFIICLFAIGTIKE